MAPTPQKRGAPNDSQTAKSVRKKITEIPQYSFKIITIKVGKDESQQTFSIHKELLAKQSEFFRAAMNNGWKEAQDGIVHLAEQDPDVFQIFQHFLYTGQVCSGKDGDRSNFYHCGNAQNDDEWGRIADAWILGETILSTSFKDALFDALVVKVVEDDVLPLDIWQTIYPASSPKAKIRDLIIDVAIWEWDDATYEKVDYKGSDEFLFGLARALNKFTMGKRQKRAPYCIRNTCIYHEHGEEGTCYKNMF